MRVGLALCLSMFCLALAAQDATRTHLNATRTARVQKRYADAEREGNTALREAEKAGTPPELLHGVLFELGLTYIDQRKWRAAEPLFRRATEVGQTANLNAGMMASDWRFWGIALHRQGRNADAIAPFERALELAQKAKGPDDPLVAWILFGLGNTHADLQKYDQAEALLRRALKIQERLVGMDRLQAADTMAQLAIVLSTESKDEEAEQLFRSCLKVREALLGPNDASIAFVLKDYGDFLRMRRRLAEAETTLRRGVAIAEKSLGPEHVLLSNLLNMLALTAEFQRKYDEAENLFLRALDIAGKQTGAEGVDATRILGSLSTLYLNQGRLAEAEKMAQRSLELRQRYNGPASPHLVVELHNLASIYSAEKRYDDAAALFRRALDIREKELGPGHPLVASDYASLATTLRLQQRFPEAETLYRKSLDDVEKRWGPKDVRTADAVLFLAGFYFAQWRMMDAEPLYRRAQAIVEEALASKPHLLKPYRTRLAGFLMDKGAVREAIEILERTVTIAAPDETKAAEAERLSMMADLYRLQGRYAKAEPLFLKAIDTDVNPSSAILRLTRLALIESARQHHAQAQSYVESALALTGKAPEASRAEALATAARVKRDNRQFAEAGKFYQQALTLMESGPVESIALGRLLADMSVSAVLQNRQAEAEPLLLRSRRILERTAGAESTHTAGCLWRLASLYRDQKRFREAEQLFQSSIAVHEKTLGDDAPALAPVLRDYALLLRAMNRGVESVPLEARAKRLADSELAAASSK